MKYTRYTKDSGPMVEAFALRDGKVVRDGRACRFPSGRFETKTAKTLEDLADDVRALRQDQAIGPGLCRHAEQGQITVAREEPKTVEERIARGVFARRRANWRFARGVPGFAPLVFDRLPSPDHLERALVQIADRFRSGALYLRESAFSRIRFRDGARCFEGFGAHGFLPVADQAEIPAILDRIFQLSLQQGFGRTEVTRSGRILFKGLVDISFPAMPEYYLNGGEPQASDGLQVAPAWEFLREGPLWSLSDFPEPDQEAIARWKKAQRAEHKQAARKAPAPVHCDGRCATMDCRPARLPPSTASARDCIHAKPARLK